MSPIRLLRMAKLPLEDHYNYFKNRYIIMDESTDYVYQYQSNALDLQNNIFKYYKSQLWRHQNDVGVISLKNSRRD